MRGLDGAIFTRLRDTHALLLLNLYNVISNGLFSHQFIFSTVEGFSLIGTTACKEIQSIVNLTLYHAMENRATENAGKPLHVIRPYFTESYHFSLASLFQDNTPL